MKELNTYIIESLQDRHFIKLQNLPAEAIQYCLNMGNEVDDIMYDKDEINKFKTKFNVDLDKKDLSLLATIIRYALSSLFVGEATGESVLKFIKNLPARRVNKFIGSGSEGIVFDAGDYIIKIITIADSLNDIDIWRSWAHASECKKLKVIAPIIKHDKDFKWIAMPKLKTPCREGKILSEAIRILYTAYKPDWSDEQISEVKEKLGKDWTWVEKWLDDFTKDYITICGVDQADKMCDDIKTANIGRTRDGKILCFDWYNPFVA